MCTLNERPGWKSRVTLHALNYELPRIQFPVLLREQADFRPSIVGAHIGWSIDDLYESHLFGEVNACLYNRKTSITLELNSGP